MGDKVIRRDRRDDNDNADDERLGKDGDSLLSRSDDRLYAYDIHESNGDCLV